MRWRSPRYSYFSALSTFTRLICIITAVCARCQARGKACTYNRDPLTAGQQPKPKPPVRIAPIRSRGPVPTSPPALRPYPPKTSSASEEETPSTSRPSSRPGDLDGDLGRDQDQNRAYYTAHGSFAGDVAAAIDVRAGIAPAATSHLVPFVDAPLFGEVVLDSPSRTPGSGVELPPRAYADRLVDIYWRYVDPVEPVLLRKCFVHDYEASYSRSGASLHADPDVWLSILNALFALAVQRQESTPRQKRDEESNRYFGRAWALLRPETIIWKPGSIDLVQCLMLMNRYLHCTNNQHKTWMTAGLAMRIAQNTGCYLPEASSAKDACKDRELKQRVWASCVGLDR